MNEISVYYLAELLGSLVNQFSTFWEFLNSDLTVELQLMIERFIADGAHETAALISLLTGPYIILFSGMTLLEVLLGSFATIFSLIVLAKFVIGIFT